MWNDSENTKLMRRLREMSELSERMLDHEMSESNYFDEFREKWGESELNFSDNKDGTSTLRFTYSKAKTPEENAHADMSFMRAIKLGRSKRVGERKRFFHLFEKYLDHWWD
jgi:hypothetical protein